MTLLPDDARITIPPLYSTEGEEDPPVVMKFFAPWSNWTWYVLEMSPHEDGDVLFFGWVVGFERELGYFLLSELESIIGPFGLKIERDEHFTPRHLSEVKRQYQQGGAHHGQ